MKKLSLAIAIVAFTMQVSCKKENTTEAATSTEANSSTESNSSTSLQNTSEKMNDPNTPKTYTITASPEVSLLGKKSEAQIKVVNIKALELSDPDGKITGTELTYQIDVTNKNAIQGGSVFMNPGDFRLELDNGNKISHDDYDAFSIAEEETKTSETQTFKIPAGTKPVALHLFFKETRAVVKLNMQE